MKRHIFLVPTRRVSLADGVGRGGVLATAVHFHYAGLVLPMLLAGVYALGTFRGTPWLDI